MLCTCHHFCRLPVLTGKTRGSVRTGIPDLLLKVWQVWYSQSRSWYLNWTYLKRGSHRVDHTIRWNAFTFHSLVLWFMNSVTAKRCNFMCVSCYFSAGKHRRIHYSKNDCAVAWVHEIFAVTFAERISWSTDLTLQECRAHDEQEFL